MMDLAEYKFDVNQGSGSSDRSTGSNPESDLNQPRSCADCKTTKTPLWRAGSNGPKSLCNACGIRYQKKMAALAPKVGAKMKNSAKIFRLIGSPSQMRAVMLNLKQGVLREEEEAAVLLMALSSGILCSAQN